MNIILIGFMGSGKSSVGQLLAKTTNRKNLEMDEYIVRLSKRKSINEIFEKDGETTFRELEIKVSKKLQDTTNTIVSTGGGIVMNKICLDYLKKNGKVIFLSTKFETIEKRLRSDTSRPLFQDKQKAKKLYALRNPLYREYANKTIVTDEKNVNDLVKEIINL